jgi:cyclase
LDALNWVKRCQELGAGELLVNSIDADGTRTGFDIEMLEAIREISAVPVIASGGAGKASDFPEAAKAGADAILAASIFHEGSVTIAEAKHELITSGFEVR